MSTHVKRVVLGAAVAAVLAVCASAGEAGWKAGGKLPDLSGFGLEGTLPSLAGQVVVLDFWASWCGPCKKSFPVLEQVHLKYKDKGVVVVGINLDKDPARMTAFLAANPVTFPIVRDAAKKVAPAAGIPAMPTTVVVGRDGVIVEIHSGFHEREEPARLEGVLEKALAAGAKTK